MVALFERYFELIPATTPALLDEAMALRYQVYCIENDFEDPAQNPGERESDVFDSHSVHCLLRHRQSRALAGVVRMVLPNPDDLSRSFPMQEVCELHQLRAKYPDFRIERAAEVSRFCISRHFRRRIGESRYPDLGAGDIFAGQPTPIRERRVMPHITLGLMKATVQIGLDYGIDHFISVMDPAFLRLLHRTGVDWQPFGPAVNYHGRRLPCHGRLNDLVEGLREHNPSFGEFVADGRPIPQ
ncbi:MAG: PEP-CTERM/exosortase system-associated acyltransferase [Pseudomonadota bacterium]